MKHWFNPLLMVFVCCVSPLASAASLSPEEMLSRMSHSFRELNYRGTFSFQQGGSTESLRMAHAVIEGEEYERLEYMDGEKREIIRRGHDLNCVHPGHQLVRFYQHGQGFQLSDDQGRGIVDHYQLEQTGVGRVAGRKVFNLAVSPKDTHRFGYRLSLDQETFLLLRTELIGAKGKVLERFQFVEVNIGGTMAKSEFPDVASIYHADHIAPIVDAADDSPSQQGWQVKWLPAGFTSAVANMDIMTDDMATFTDGLSVFSVFIERDIDAATIKKGIEGRAQRGATTAYSRALLLAGKPHRVTVVGEIPPHTAQQIAQSITLVGAQN